MSTSEDTGVSKGGDTTWLRRTNLIELVRTLRMIGPAGLSELSRAAGLSRPTVERLVGTLLAGGWADELPASVEGVGRPSRRFRFRPSSVHIVGIDIGAHSVRCVVADLDGTMVSSVERSVGPRDGRAARFGVVKEAIDAVVAAAGLTPADISVVCAGTAGIISAAGDVFLSAAIPEWTGFELGQELSSYLGCAAVIENDTNLATLAEKWQGVATHFDDVAFVLAGTRTSAGLISGGVLLRGSHGAAGEIGALNLLGWQRAPQHFIEFPGLPEDVAEHESPEWVMRAARNGDETAKEAVEKYTSDLAEGIAALALVVDPEVVVLGGGASRSSDVLLKPLERHLAPLCIVPPVVLISSLGDQAVVQGAVRRALDVVEERLYDAEGPLARTGTD